MEDVTVFKCNLVVKGRVGPGPAAQGRMFPSGLSGLTHPWRECCQERNEWRGKHLPEEQNGVGTESEGTKRGCGVVGSKNGGEWAL